MHTKIMVFTMCLYITCVGCGSKTIKNKQDSSNHKAANVITIKEKKNITYAVKDKLTDESIWEGYNLNNKQRLAIKILNSRPTEDLKGNKCITTLTYKQNNCTKKGRIYDTYLSLCYSRFVMNSMPEKPVTNTKSYIPEKYCIEAEKVRQKLSVEHGCEVILPSPETKNRINSNLDLITVNGLLLKEFIEKTPPECKSSSQ